MSEALTRKDFLKALPMILPVFRALASPTATAERIELRSVGMRITVVVGTGGVWLEQFFLKRAKFDSTSFTTAPWTRRSPAFFWKWERNFPVRNRLASGASTAGRPRDL